MKTPEELKAMFTSSGDMETIFQKRDFINLSDEEIRLLRSIDGLVIHISPKASEYIDMRMKGQAKPEPEPKDDEPEREMTPERATAIIGATMRNPRVF